MSIKPAGIKTGTAVELDNGLVVFKDRRGYVLGSNDVGKQKPIPFGWRRIVRTFVPVEVSA